MKMVEHPPESGGGNPAQQSCARREAPVGTDQMFAPSSHWRTYRHLWSGWQAPDLTFSVQRFIVNRNGNG